MRSRHWFVVAILAAVLLLAATPARAAARAAAQGEIPSSAVARLKIVTGTAWVRTGGAGEWEEAVTNYPLAEGSRVSVPEDSEAEVQIRGTQSLDLPGAAEIDIVRLDPNDVSWRLRDGRARLSLPAENFAPVQVDVPGGREVRLEAPGEYSFSTNGESTRFLVSAGTGAVTGPEGSPVAVHAGEEASIGSDVRVGRAEVPAAETPREPVLTSPEQEAGVPPEVAGELRPYGEWVQTPDYGYAWRPYVSDEWEPYYYGRWVWVSPYGWSWVGYEPWGWWPYHTGWWWPSPAYGWVWCPYRSFVSVNFSFGGSMYHGYHARFHGANVRFEGRGGFIRWVPERPGVTGSGLASFGRQQTALARWNRPVARGSVRMRTDGGTPVAWRARGVERARSVRGANPGAGSFDRELSSRRNGGSTPSYRNPSIGRGYGNGASYRGPSAGRGFGTTPSYQGPSVGRGYGNGASYRGPSVGRGYGNGASYRGPSVGRGFGTTPSYRGPSVGRGFGTTPSYRGPSVGRGYGNSASDRGPSVGRGYGTTPSYRVHSIGRIGGRFEGSRGGFGGSRGFGRNMR